MTTAFAKTSERWEKRSVPCLKVVALPKTCWSA